MPENHGWPRTHYIEQTRLASHLSPVSASHELRYKLVPSLACDSVLRLRVKESIRSHSEALLGVRVSVLLWSRVPASL